MNSTIVLNRTTILGSQTTTYGGGGIYARDGSTIILSNSAVSGCRGSSAGGGAAVLDYTHVVLYNTTFNNNTAGVSVSVPVKSRGGADLANTTMTADVEGPLATEADGGAIWATGNATVTVHASSFHNNVAYRGGALGVWEQAEAEFLPPLGKRPGGHGVDPGWDPYNALGVVTCCELACLPETVGWGSWG